jgi:hypothetical protein
VISESHSHRARAARRRSWLLGFLLLRALVLLFSVELSGLAHAALDVCGVAEAASDDCDGEGAGHECPPGCTTCHCWHAGTPSAPLAMTFALKLFAQQLARTGFSPRIDVAPRGADPESLYRPPRAAAFAS